jgi:YD repeat-containing protein
MKYKYPADFSTNPYTTMLAKNIISPIIEQQQYLNTTWLQTLKTDYKNWGNSIFAPEFVKKQTNKQSAPDTEITYHKYDTYGNPLYISNATDKLIYLWGYSNQYPVAEIKGATYDEVTSKIPQADLDTISGKSSLSDADIVTLNSLRTQLPSAQITTYTYKPLVGMLTATDPRGVTTYYEYDDFGRLKERYYYENGVKTSANKRKVEEYKYNYRQ